MGRDQNESLVMDSSGLQTLLLVWSLCSVSRFYRLMEPTLESVDGATPMNKAAAARLHYSFQACLVYGVGWERPLDTVLRHVIPPPGHPWTLMKSRHPSLGQYPSHQMKGGPSFVALYCEQCEDHSSSKEQNLHISSLCCR